MSKSDETRLGVSRIIVFMLPALVLGFMHGPEVQLQGIYAKYAGLTLAALAVATLFTRMFDAVTYPVIGYLSDLTFARFGTRKPWVVGGALTSALGVWFLYRPPADVGIAYYGVWTAVTYLGWKLAEIPYQAWSFGLTRDYKRRASVQAWKLFATTIGGTLFFLTPAIAKAMGIAPTAELGLEALGLAAVVCAVLVPLVMIVAIWRVPEGEASPPTALERKNSGVGQTIRAVVSNGPMMRLTVGFLPAAIVTGMAAGSSFLFLDSYLGLGSHFPILMLIVAPMALLGIPIWGWLAGRFERHHVMSASMLLGSVAYLGLAFVQPGPHATGIVMILYPLAVFAVLGVVAVFTMVGDVADYGRLQSGEDLSGLYAAMFNFVYTSLRAVSGAAGIAIIGWMGFDANAAAQTESGALGIRLIAVILPCICMAASGFLFLSYPLTRAKLAEVRGELNSRDV